MCTNIYGQAYLSASSSSSSSPSSKPPLKSSLSRSKSTTTRPTSLINSSSSTLPSSSAVFLQSALQCFYHHLTPDTLILPQSYLIPPTQTQSYHFHLHQHRHYHQHLQQYYHQLMLSIQADQKQNLQNHDLLNHDLQNPKLKYPQNNLLASSAAALLLDQIAYGSLQQADHTIEEEVDLMTRSMPSAAYMEQMIQLGHHHHHGQKDSFQQISNQNQKSNQSKDYRRKSTSDCFNRDVQIQNPNHHQSSFDDDRLRCTSMTLERNNKKNPGSDDKYHYQRTPTHSSSTALSSSGKCLKSKKVFGGVNKASSSASSSCHCITGNASSTDGSTATTKGANGSFGYVTELVAKFEQRITVSPSLTAASVASVASTTFPTATSYSTSLSTSTSSYSSFPASSSFSASSNNNKATHERRQTGVHSQDCSCPSTSSSSSTASNPSEANSGAVGTNHCTKRFIHDCNTEQSSKSSQQQQNNHKCQKFVTPSEKKQHHHGGDDNGGSYTQQHQLSKNQDQICMNSMNHHHELMHTTSSLTSDSNSLQCNNPHCTVHSNITSSDSSANKCENNCGGDINPITMVMATTPRRHASNISDTNASSDSNIKSTKPTTSLSSTKQPRYNSGISTNGTANTLAMASTVTQPNSNNAVVLKSCVVSPSKIPTPKSRSSSHHNCCCCCCCAQCSGPNGPNNGPNSNSTMLGINLSQLCCSSNKSTSKINNSLNNKMDSEKQKINASIQQKDILATTTTTSVPATTTTTTNLNNNVAVPPSSKLTPSSINSHHHHLHNPLVLPSHHHPHHHPVHHKSTKSSLSRKVKTSGTETVLIETSLDSNSEASESANSDNSSTDEGIDNPEDVVLDDDDDDDENPEEVVLNLENPDGILSVGHHHHPHSHHEHHHNHHYQHHHHRRHRNPSNSETVSSKTSSSAIESVSETADYYPDDPEYQVERYLNGTNAKHYQDLKREEANLLKEIQEVEREQSTPKPPKEPKKSDDNDEEDDDEDDEELLEFQKIEREIKLSELRKCLQVIQKQIENCRVQMHKDEQEAEGVNKSQKRPTSSAFDFVTSMTDSMLEECRLDAAAQVILSEEEESKSRAPLAVADEWDTESQITSYESIPSVTKPSSPTKPQVPPKPSLNGNLSDSDDSEDESPVLPSVPPKTPPRRESLKSSTSSTVAGPEAILFDRNEFYRQSLHEDALHESIEQSLQLVNSVSDADVERFVISTNTKPPIASSNGSIIRRESQYENEQTHACGATHRRGYELIQKSNKKLQLQNGSSGSEEQQQQQKSQSLDDLLGKPTEKDLDDELALRRRSAKFPNTVESSNLESSNSESNGTNEVRKRNSDSSNTINGSNTNGNSRTSLASNSQRPLTLYLPSPNEELNLISHLHALGHDLTSSIVTNNLLLTPFTCSGYLYKQCAGSSTKWRKRYFHFNRVRKVFVYFHDRTAFEKRRHPKRGVFFDEIQDVYVDHTRINMKKFLSGQQSPSHLSHHSTNVSTASSSHTKADGNTRCVFVVATTTMNRKFILSTFSPELMRIWMDVIFTGANAYLQDYDNFDV